MNFMFILRPYPQIIPLHTCKYFKLGGKVIQTLKLFWSHPFQNRKMPFVYPVYPTRIHILLHHCAKNDARCC